jgi:HSP20 family protein
MLRTYNLFDDIMDLRSTIDSFMNSRASNAYNVTLPLVNLYEKDDKVTVKVLAPGAAIEDIHLQLIDNRLHIEVEKKKDQGDKNYVREERTFGKFSKSIKMPYKVDADSIDASLKNGILSVAMAKSEDAKPKKIEIH